ncbi:response regulator transcription factor [Govanella unica]|uniref:LuxR C-terminal-related transcriptional regulator n=1 Tax=Govanella unica TaxID=2975056 RepID=A0A9X3TZP3_9PROT|nr:LuxR C-terminal-related transcriptional regulator [Govania unica]MDA5194437.1 LuxR C-terminal-related transcriptional regulator [Govania unica]
MVTALDCNAPLDFSQAILGFIGDIVPTTGRCFYRVDDRMQVFDHHLFNLAQEWLTAYQDHYCEFDPLHPSRCADKEAKIAILNDSMTSDRHTRNYMTSFLMPQETPYQLEVYLRHDRRIVAGLSLVRGVDMGPFSLTERALLERMVPFAEFCLDRILGHPAPSVPDEIGLTEREREIVQLVCAGLSNKEICRRLGIELPTVKTHLSRIFGKAGVQTRTALVHRLYRGN